LRTRFDDRSHPTEISFYDTDDRPCNFAGEFAVLRSQFDARGFQTRVEYFDRLNRPCKAKVGYARIDRTVSDDRHTVESRTYGTDGKPIGDSSGVECWTVRYDEHDREVERRFWKPSGQPFMSTEGYTGWRKSFDERGNVIECNFLGADGGPCLSTSGVARWTAVYNDLSPGPVHTYFDLDGRHLRKIVMVIAVEAGSRAEMLDVRVGDVLVTYAGRLLSTANDFTTIRETESPEGPNHELVARRNGSDVRLMLPPERLGMRYANRWVPK
jgi:hypothetical protein